MTCRFKKKIYSTFLLLLVSVICSSIGILSYNPHNLVAHAASYAYWEASTSNEGSASSWWKNPRSYHVLSSLGQYGAANVSPKNAWEAGWVAAGNTNNLTDHSMTEVAFEGGGKWSLIYVNFMINLPPEYNTSFTRGEIEVTLGLDFLRGNNNDRWSYFSMAITQSDQIVQRGSDNNTFDHNNNAGGEWGLNRLGTSEDKKGGAYGNNTTVNIIKPTAITGGGSIKEQRIAYEGMNGTARHTDVSFRLTKRWFTVYLVATWSNSQSFRYRNMTVNLKEVGAPPNLTADTPSSGWATSKTSLITATDPSGIKSLTIGGKEYVDNLNYLGQFYYTATKNETVTVVATDKIGNKTTRTITFSNIYREEVAITKEMINGGSGDAGGSATSNKTVYTHSEMITLTAKANNGYFFAGWYLNNTLISSNPSYVRQVNANENNHGTKFNYVAKFSPIADRITDKVGYNGSAHAFYDVTPPDSFVFKIYDADSKEISTVTDVGTYTYYIAVFKDGRQVGTSNWKTLTITQAAITLYRNSNLSKTYDTLAVGALDYRFTLDGAEGTLDSNKTGTLYASDTLQLLTWNVTDYTEAGSYAINVDLGNKASNNYVVTWASGNGADGRPNSVDGLNFVINQAKIWMYRDSSLTKIYDGLTIPTLEYHFFLEGASSRDTLFGSDVMPTQSWNINGATDCTYSGQAYLGHAIQGSLIAPTNNYSVDWWATDNATDGKAHNPVGQYFVITRATQNISFTETSTIYSPNQPIWDKVITDADNTMTAQKIYSTNDAEVFYIDDDGQPHIIRSTYQKSGVYLTVSISQSNNYEAATATVEITIDRAKYLPTEVPTHTKLSGTYDKTKSLKDDYAADTHFVWQDETICPTVRKNDEGYPARYNADSINYYDYSCYINITLDPALHGMAIDLYKNLTVSLKIKHTSTDTSLPLVTLSNSGFAVEFSTQSGAGKYTISDGKITFNSIGVTNIRAYVHDQDGNYVPYEDYFTITVLGNQDIKFAETEYIKFDSEKGIYYIDNTITYGDAALSVQAVALGTRLATISLIEAKDKLGNVTQQSNIAAYNNFQLFINGAGSIKLKASLAGSPDYLATEEIIEIQIIPRVLKVNFADEITVDYGQFDPNNFGLQLSYSNFVAGDNISNIGLKTPTIINNNSLGKFSDVGRYAFSIADGDATNYTLELVEDGVITVLPIEVTLEHTQFVTTYTGSNQVIDTQNTTISGINGGSTPKGAITYKYYIDGEMKDEAPINSGEYNIVIVYNAAMGDNYKNTQIEKALGIKIRKVSMAVSIEDLHLTYGSFDNTKIGEYFTLGYNNFVNGETADSAAGFRAPSIQNSNGLGQFSNVTIDGYKFSLSGGVADNYEFDLTDTAIIYIDKASVTVDINNATVKYGEYLADQNHITFGTAYTGFLDNQSVATGSVDGFVAPTIVSNNNLEVNRYSDVGTYNFGMTGGSSTNYTFVITDTATLSIIQTSIVLDNLAANYNNEAILFSANNIKGITNGSNLSGSYTIYYSSNNIDFSTESPTNAGYYYIKVSYVAGDKDNYAAADYYTTLVVNRIAIADAVIDNIINNNTAHEFSKTEGYTANYNGMIHQPTGRIFGLAEQSIGDMKSPQGTFTFIYSTDGINYVDQAPKNNGEYIIKVKYISAAIDNYTNNASLVIAARIVIKKISIEQITLPNAAKNYTGKGVTSAVPFASGISQGTIPQGTYIRQYALSGTNNWSQELPIDAAEYDVKVGFVANVNDNYFSSVEDKIFKNALTIKKIYTKMTLTPKTYNFGEVAVANVTALGVNNEDISGVMNYTYILNGIESADIPTQSGKYAVKAVFVPSENSNYLVTSNRYNNAVIILNITPKITLYKHITTYDGKEISTDIIQALAKLNEENGKANGKLVIEYQLKRDNSAWSRIAPREAGKYDIRVKYVEDYLSDNYSSSLNWIELEEALDIKQIEAIIVITENQSKIYDGLEIDVSTIDYTIMVDNNIVNSLIFGNYITGNLGVSTDVNCGNKSIDLGSLNAGNNYNLTLQKIGSYAILQKEVTVTLSLADNVYDGQNKEVEVILTGIVSGDDIGLNVEYKGERLAVSEEGFSVVASIANTNYLLIGSNTATYKILEAKMTNNIYQSKTVVYNALQQLFVMDSIEDGATVEYLTETSYINAGEYTLRARITKPNYREEVLTATVTITKATPNVIVYPVGKKLYYGDPIPTITCNIAEGNLSIDAGQELKGGTNIYNYTFVPNDLANYNIVKGFINLTVEKYEPIIIVNGNIKHTVNSRFEVETILSGLDQFVFEPEIFFISSSGAKLTEVPNDVGKYTMVIRYKGNENYKEVEYRTTFTVVAPSNYTPIIAVTSVLVILFLASGIMFALKRKKNGNNF